MTFYNNNEVTEYEDNYCLQTNDQNKCVWLQAADLSNRNLMYACTDWDQSNHCVVVDKAKLVIDGGCVYWPSLRIINNQRVTASCQRCITNKLVSKRWATVVSVEYCRV